MAYLINDIIVDPVKRAKFEARFWPKVTIAGPDECWLWTASVNSKGYGQIAIWVGRTIPIPAHQAAMALANGPIPDGLCTCHKCDVPGCVNANHLFLGTQKENMDDRDAKGRVAVIPKMLTEEQVIAILADKRMYKEIAADHGVHIVTICDIKLGKTWHQVPRPDPIVKNMRSQAKLTEAQVLKIFHDPRSQYTIAREYDVKRAAISAIKTGRAWSAVTGKIKNGDET